MILERDNICTCRSGDYNLSNSLREQYMNIQTEAAATSFASPDRLDTDQIQEQIRIVASHPVITEVLNASGGLFAVLNEHRQIVAINDSFLACVGVTNAEEAMGLRLGEQLQCVHACETAGGCGTSSYCSTCGAVIATLAALAANSPVEQTCVISTEKDYQEFDLYFNVRCNPLQVDKSRFILLYLQDISIHQQWANLEQTFLHDISNTLQGLVGTSSLLTDESQVTVDRLNRIRSLTLRLAQEVSAQKMLSTTLSHTYKPLYAELSVQQIFNELQEIFSNHTLSRNRKISITAPESEIRFTSDHALVVRILSNMVSNALEATPLHGSVRIQVEADGDIIIFCVWNSGRIPDNIAKRIFQRNFTTKEALGHGLGTYSMKLFGEKVLGGRVSFSSSEAGTTFRFAVQYKQ